MAAHVFISHSAKDKHAADAACAILERRGIRCWIAPRDILPSENWGAAIIEAIEGCKLMVLVVSGNANSSRQIEREVERAINLGRPVIPFRIEDIKPTKALEYFISASHWLDAFTPPVEQHLDRLADVVRSILDKSGGAEDTASGEGSEDTATGERSRETKSTTMADAKASASPQKSFPLMRVAVIAIVALVATVLLSVRNQKATPIAVNPSGSQIAELEAERKAEGEAMHQKMLRHLKDIEQDLSQASPASRGGQTGASPESSPAPLAGLPEDVPSIRDRELEVVRRQYLSAPDHKAIALSDTRASFASAKPDDKSAIAAAMDACQVASDSVGPGYKCQLYAIGNVVVYKVGRPPMPSPH